MGIATVVAITKIVIHATAITLREKQIFLGQKKAPVTRGLLAERCSLSTFWPPTAHWVVGVKGAAVNVHFDTHFIYESTLLASTR